MRFSDLWRYTWAVLSRHGVRTLLLLLVVAMGVASVVLLTGLGEGARRYVQREFSALGSQLLIVLPGKKETTGGAPPLYGVTPRDLTLEDAEALGRIDTVEYVAPIIAGTAMASVGGLSRDVITLGSTPDLFIVRQMAIAEGRGLPDVAYSQATPVVVIGAKIRRELFGDAEAVGRWMRLGDRRFRVAGVLAERGESLGMDLRDMAVIPLRSAEQLFNANGLFRVLIQMASTDSAKYTEREVIAVIKQRHDGEDDITVITQDSVMSAFNQILNTLTAVIGAIASISLVVAGILIMNVSLVSVTQRREEIGLLKALGASRATILRLFLMEAMMLVTSGIAIGLLFAQIILAVARQVFPAAPLASPWWAVLAAIVIAAGVGLFFSWWPARRAAALDPVLALRSVV